MQLTILHLSTAFEIGEVDPRIFGGFLEHMGRSIYEGVYEPSSPHADEDGFRSDVLEALRGLEVTLVRYPGGN
ncbi:MAG: alpha-L-arabinofuranosidase, partial [Myxococcota bacterium]